MPAASAPILITRHGLSEHNLETRFYMGRAPASRLVAEGRAQATALGRHLVGWAAEDPERRSIRRIVASSLPRTSETAELIATELNASREIGTAAPVRVDLDDAFWEMSKGAWEGAMPRNEVPEPERTEWEERPFGFKFPGGESFAEVAERVVPAFDRWVGEYPGQRLLFVLHGDVVCALLYRLLGFPPEDIRRYLVPPCSMTELMPEPGAWRMLRFGDDRFLRHQTSPAAPG